jgi:hypothetical protein
VLGQPPGEATEAYTLHSSKQIATCLSTDAQPVDSSRKDICNETAGGLSCQLATKPNGLSVTPSPVGNHSVVLVASKELSSETSADASRDIAVKRRQGTNTLGSHSEGSQPEPKHVSKGLKGIRSYASDCCVRMPATSQKVEKTAVCLNEVTADHQSNMEKKSDSSDIVVNSLSNGVTSSFSSVHNTVCLHSDLIKEDGASPAEKEDGVSGTFLY